MKKVSNRNKKFLLTTSAEAVMFLFILLIKVFLLPGDSSALIGIKEGDNPKKIMLDDLNGKTVNVTNFFAKRPVILVFWELATDKSFLNYSLDELLFLNDFYEEYHDKAGLEVFGIYTPVDDKDIPESEILKVKNLVKMNKITFPVLIDTGFKMFREYGVIALPSTVMIDKKGTIEFIYPSFPIAARPLFSEKIMDLVGAAKIVQKKEDIKIKERESHSRRLYHYALQMYKRGLAGQAMSPLKKSLDLDPDFTWSHNLMGIILRKSGDFEGSKKEFERAIKLDRYNAPAHFNYGLLLFENERYNEAEEQFSVSVALDDAMAEAHYVLGLLYKKTDRPNEALKELKTALALFEKRKVTPVIFNASTLHKISTLYALSELHSQRGNKEKALKVLQKAARIAIGINRSSDKGLLHISQDLMIYE